MGQKTNSENRQAMVQADREGTLMHMKQLFVNQEAKLNSQDELKLLVEDSGELITEPGYMNDHLTLFIQSIHLYQIRKCIVAKEMAMTTNKTLHSEAEPSLQDIENEVLLIQRQLQNQNAYLGRIHIPCLMKSELPGSRAKDLASVESSDDQWVKAMTINSRCLYRVSFMFSV